MADNIFKRYDSVTEFKAYLDESKTQRRFKNEESLRKCEWGDWYGTKTYKEADDMLAKGAANIAQEIYDGVAIKTKALHHTVRKVTTSQVGFAPHVPNFIAGRPNAMIRCEKQQAKTRAITVVYNISVNAGISAQEMKQTAIKMLSAIRTLEAHGTRVNLYVCDMAYYDGYSSSQTTGWLLKIKSSTQHLDILKTAYPLCCPAMLRRHSFRWTEVTKGIAHSGYGAATNRTDKLLNACGLKNAITINYHYASELSVEALAEDILEQASKLKR